MTDPVITPEAPRHVPLMLAGAGLLAIAGLGLFWAASAGRPGDETLGGVEVTVDGDACSPMALEVPAGPASFLIRNASERPLEWEILDGVMVLAERENIAPGFSSVLQTRLKPGTYAITCGLLSNPRGTLTVLATAQSEAERTAPPLREFLAPLSERRVQMLRAAGKFVTETGALQAALEAGDLAAAQASWRAAAAQWAALGLVSNRAADLENRIAPRAEWLAGREADPGFTGLTRIEYGLFAQGSTEGLAPVAAQLSADAAEMKARVAALEPTPADLAGDAARRARHLAEGQIAAGLSPYDHDEGALLGASLAAIARSAALVQPLLSAADPGTAAQLETALAKAQGTLDDPAQAPAAFADLAAALEAVNAKLGLE